MKSKCFYWKDVDQEKLGNMRDANVSMTEIIAFLHLHFEDVKNKDDLNYLTKEFANIQASALEAMDNQNEFVFTGVQKTLDVFNKKECLDNFKSCEDTNIQKISNLFHTLKAFSDVHSIPVLAEMWIDLFKYFCELVEKERKTDLFKTFFHDNLKAEDWFKDVLSYYWDNKQVW